MTTLSKTNRADEYNAGRRFLVFDGGSYETSNDPTGATHILEKLGNGYGIKEYGSCNTELTAAQLNHSAGTGNVISSPQNGYLNTEEFRKFIADGVMRNEAGQALLSHDDLVDVPHFDRGFTNGHTPLITRGTVCNSTFGTNPNNNTDAARLIADGNRTHRDQGFIRAFTDMQMLYFCSGLHEKIRSYIEPKFSEFTSYDQMLERACDVERSNRSVTTTPMAPLNPSGTQSEPTMASLLKEINALKSLQRSTQSGQQRPATSPSSGTQPKRGPPGPDLVKRAHLNAKIQKQQSFRFCNKCRQWGKHVQNECRANKTEIASLTPQDPGLPPSDGTPLTDWFWDGKPTVPPTGN